MKETGKNSWNTVGVLKHTQMGTPTKGNSKMINIMALALTLGKTAQSTLVTLKKDSRTGPVNGSREQHYTTVSSNKAWSMAKESIPGLRVIHIKETSNLTCDTGTGWWNGPMGLFTKGSGKTGFSTVWGNWHIKTGRSLKVLLKRILL